MNYFKLYHIGYRRRISSANYIIMGIALQDGQEYSRGEQNQYNSDKQIKSPPISLIDRDLIDNFVLKDALIFFLVEELTIY